MRRRTDKKSIVSQLLLLTLAVVLVFAIGRTAGWITTRAAIASKQREIKRAVEKLDGVVYYDFQRSATNPDDLLDLDAPDARRAWLSHVLGIDFVHDIFYIHLASFKTSNAAQANALRNQDVSDELLEDVDLLPGLQWFALSGTGVTDAGIASLCKNQVVQRLWLSQTPITDRALEMIAGCPSMTHLAIEATPTSDAGLAAIAKLPQLKVLSIGSPLITPTGLRRLATLRSLTDLHVDLLPVEDSTLRAWSGLANLQLLSLRKTAITDADVPLLNQFQQLRELHLDGLNLTDQALSQGLTLPELETLTIEQTQISDQGLQQLGACKNLVRLKAARTQCTLTGACQLFTKQLGRTLHQGLSAVAATRLNADGHVISLDTQGIRFTDSDVEFLSQLTELEWLTATHCPLTDRGAAALSKLQLPRLTMLNLNYTSLTDEGLHALAGIPSLTNLHVAETRVTDQAINALRKAHPNLAIYNSDLQAKQRIVRTLESN